MAAITYNKTTPLGSMVSSLVNGTIQMQFLSNRIKNVVDAAVDSDTKYAQLETMFELPTGTGQEFYQIISTIADVLTKISGLPKLDLG
jgi:hypothetical protein